MIWMKRLAPVLVAILLTSVCVGGPAEAQLLRIHDPAGDGEHGDDLDITSVRVHNRDNSILVRIWFVRTTPRAGDLALFFKEDTDRRRDLIRVLNVRQGGNEHSRVDSVDGRVPCPGLDISWNDTADTVRVLLPAACLHGGDYEAIQIQALTEYVVDADYAPQGPKGNLKWSRPIARGVGG